MDQAAEFYNKNPEREWGRLVRDPYHSLEFLVTMHHLRKYLPPNGRVLDAGGGPGRYSQELCRAGYQVVLLDMSSELLALAKENFKSEPRAVRKRLLEFVLGDIRDLSRFETNFFDVVLCLGGPLTHISDGAGRAKAMSELVRIAKPSAIVCLSVMGYLAALRTLMTRFSHELLTSSFQTFVRQGDITGTTGTLWHFFRADELRQMTELYGLTTLQMAGCEGLSTGLMEATNLLGQDKAKWERWVELVLETSVEPSAIDMSEHILYIGKLSRKRK